MAVVAGVVKEAYNFVEEAGNSPVTNSGSTPSKMLRCFVTVEYPTGTYASADDANFAPATLIQNERRNGKTVTIRQASFVSPGVENGTVLAAGACTVSAGTITHPLLQEDLSTERANGAMAAFDKPLTFCVSFTEARG